VERGHHLQPADLSPNSHWAGGESAEFSDRTKIRRRSLYVRLRQNQASGKIRFELHSPTDPNPKHLPHDVLVPGLPSISPYVDGEITLGVLLRNDEPCREFSAMGPIQDPAGGSPGLERSSHAPC
jgi:hypothetical protein